MLFCETAYTEIVCKLPKDVVILTAGCAKYKYNRLDLGDIGGIPRELDAGQCNGSYSLALSALRLKEVFVLAGINELPIAFNIAWYEQKAVSGREEHPPQNSNNFNPPTPHGVGLPLGVKMIERPEDFNPPTPHGVGLQSHGRAGYEVVISIHPPRTGWDHTGYNAFSRTRNFNPPTPHGVGLAGDIVLLTAVNLNPPTPHGVGLAGRARSGHTYDFNPPTPHGVGRC